MTAVVSVCGLCDHFPMPMLGFILAAAYFGCAVGAAVRIRRGQGDRSPLLLAALTMTAVLHATMRIAELNSYGLDLSFFAALELFSWTGLITLLVAALWVRTENYAVIVAPITGIAIVLGVLFPTADRVVVTGDWQMNLHIAFAVVAWSVLSLAAVHALLLSAQERMLRQHQPMTLARALPPVTVMNRLLDALVRAGFVLLTLALATGAMFIVDMREQSLIHKTVLSAIAWAVFGWLLLGQWRYGWRGRTAARFVLIGMALLILAYFGSKFVLELILGRP